MEDNFEIELNENQLGELKICIENTLIEIESEIRRVNIEIISIENQRRETIDINKIKHLKEDKKFYESELEKLNNTKKALGEVLEKLGEKQK